MMTNHTQTNCYDRWYDSKVDEEIEYDLRTAVEKSGMAEDLLKGEKVESILDYGCGYGKCTHDIMCAADAKYGLGCDISSKAIMFARDYWPNTNLHYIKISENPKTAVSQIRQEYHRVFDVTLLFDVLEHIPNPKNLIKRLAPITKRFLIILPLDNNLFNNYILPQRMKEYPSPAHPDGHLREHNVNDVHQFIVSLGLIIDRFNYNYLSIKDQYPDHLRPKRLKGRILYECVKYSKYVLRAILPKRIYLRLIGNGCFVCLARAQ